VCVCATTYIHSLLPSHAHSSSLSGSDAARFLPAPSRPQLTPQSRHHVLPARRAHNLTLAISRLTLLPVSSRYLLSHALFAVLQFPMVGRLCHLSNFRLPSASTSHLTAYSVQAASLSVSIFKLPFWSSVFSLIIVKATLVQGTRRPQLHLAGACLLEPPAAVMFHNQSLSTLSHRCFFGVIQPVISCP
jgi:hypothetical protein